MSWFRKKTDAAKRQQLPKGTGPDIAQLALSKLPEAILLTPEHGMRTIQTWMLSAAAYLVAYRSRGPMTAQDILNTICKDIDARVAAGEKKYGQRLRAHNGRDAALDLLQEVYDAWLYAEQERYESGT